MTTTNWNNVLIRCSSLGCLFTDPVSKADKEAGVLSKTAKAHLIEVYANEIWGMEKDIVTAAIKKGRQAEESGIDLLSQLDKKLYLKNDERKENGWVSGCADIIEDNRITDIKISWNAFTFLPQLIEPIDKDYFYQLQAYMWLWDKQEARISYCLIDTPDNIIEGEKYRLLRGMDVVSEESPEFKEAAARLVTNMKFNHISPNLRVINKLIDRDEEIIEKIPQKVQRAREFLAQLQKLHSFIA